MPALKKGPKIALCGIGALIFVFGLRSAAEHGLIPTPGFMKSVVPTKAVLPDVKEAAIANVEPFALPSDAPANVQATLIRGEIWEWNAMAGMIYANGGPTTTKGSLMEKHSVNLALIRQDNTNQMQADLLACASELAAGASQCSTGANFVIIMGDGAGQFIAGINPQLKKLGAQWQLKAIGAVGYSRGEDAFMAEPAVKNDPQAARGILVAGVLRDGDWNIALKWEGDNNIPNNPNEKTYDPNAVNWLNTDDYLKASESYNANQCEDRKIVKDGHPTGETKHVCVNAVVTWTPGDVNIAHGRGGLIKVVSSKQYRSQMPSTIIGPAAFFQKNRDEVNGFLAAIFEGGDQLKAYDKALRKAAEISAKVYNDQDGAYWYKYFKGITETDAAGIKVELGGSSVCNLADEKILFGLAGGANDNFRATYTVFANIVNQQYPLLFKDTPIPDVKDVEDKSFITGAEAVMNGQGAEAETPNYSAEASGPKVSNRSYSINFATDQATFLPDGENTMRQLRDSLSITALFIQVDGYTDNTGNEEHNQDLSQRRALAVKQWLQGHAPANFPSTRFRIAGHGSEKPVDSNATASGRAANRRVEITLLGN
jgi:OmpA-OmpF porin, OOP family